MGSRTPDSLEQRVREGASIFEFGALMGARSGCVAGEGLATGGPMENEPINEGRVFHRPRLIPEPVIHLPQRSPIISILIMALFGILAIGGWGLYLKGAAPTLVSNRPLVIGAQPQPPPITDSAETGKVGLPRPAITPGERTETAKLPSAISDEVRREVFAAYGLGPEVKSHIPVRLIPAELGGTNHLRNVFPLTPWFAGLKARLDTFLVQEVRAGGMSLIQAESELTSNWVKACHLHYIRNYGKSGVGEARRAEDRLRW